MDARKGIASEGPPRHPLVPTPAPRPGEWSPPKHVCEHRGAGHCRGEEKAHLPVVKWHCARGEGHGHGSSVTFVQDPEARHALAHC